MKTTYFVGEVSARVGSLEGEVHQRVLVNPRRTHGMGTGTSTQAQEYIEVQKPPSNFKRTYKYRNLQACKPLCFMGT
jgi:hypothetical protein